MESSAFCIEICCNSLASAKAAQAGGAHRIELCADLELGGMTPSAATIRMSRQALDIPVYVLIRPRPGDFIYSDEEKKVILEDIAFCREQSCDGIVVGALLPDATIDRDFLMACKEAAGAMDLTFHRAFDFTRDAFAALETLIDCGVSRVLSSGQQADVMSGRDCVKKLVVQAAGRISVMPGGGLHENNIRLLADYTGAREFHLSAKKVHKSTQNWHPRHLHIVHQEIVSDYDYWYTDAAQVEKIILKMQTGES